MTRLYKCRKLETTLKITGANVTVTNLAHSFCIGFFWIFFEIENLQMGVPFKKQKQLGGLLDESLSLTSRAEVIGNSSRLHCGARGNKMFERLYALFLSYFPLPVFVLSLSTETTLILACGLV